MGFGICEVFGIPPKNLEVGYSMLTKYGIITHIVHYIYEDDLEIMEEELLDEIEGQINVTPKFYVSQLYAAMQTNINSVFKQHFSINDEFDVTLQHRLSARKRTMTQEDNNTGNKRNDIDLKESKLGSLDIKNVLEKYFNQKRVTTEMDRLNILTQLTSNQETNKEETVDDAIDVDLSELMVACDNVPELETDLNGEMNVNEQSTMEIEMEALNEQVSNRL